MNRNYFAHAVPALLTVLLSTTLAAAQTAQTQAAAPASQIAKPSPYQGVSTPPPDDTIITSEEAPAHKPLVAPPATPPAAKPTPQADAGLVVTSAPPDDSSDADSNTPVLKTRSADASDDDADTADDAAGDEIVTYLPGPANALPEGTVFRVRMLQDIDAANTAPGTPFRATLTRDVLHDGRIVVPYGSELRGKIIYTTYGRRIGGRSVIHLRADEFVLPDGTRYYLHAQVIDTLNSDTKVIGEGNISSKDHPKVLLAETAATSGAGALVGAGLGGPAGAAVGSAVGAGFIGTHWLMATHAAYLPAQSTVVFSLTDPMFLTPKHD